jgi:DNA-binding helix-hairpin-helix protein with protein kinase domain
VAYQSREIRGGATFRTARGGHVGRIGRLLGAGGQGEVYEADLHGGRFAVKWFHPSYAELDSGLRPRLSRAIERGAPNDAFLWPIDIVEISGQLSFGYLMRLRDPDYAGMRQLIARPPERLDPPVTVRATICLRIAESFLELHSSGFCYQDVNFGNVFFHPDSGEILICDNDNVDIDGAPASVYGTRKFMAPEIVRRETMPNTRSDLFSMAVLFFYVLHGWHPLDGRREAAALVMDAATEHDLYGVNPLFLFDSADRSNGPVPGMHEPIEARWKALPSALRALFLRSFTVGLRHPGQRVQESEWRTAFASLLAGNFACSACGFEHAVETGGGSSPAHPAYCMACASPLSTPPVLLVGRSAVCLVPGRRVPMQLLAASARPGADTVCVTVEAHPNQLGVLGLRNHTRETWRLTLPEGSAIAVPPGAAMRLVNGATVEFGAAAGTVVMADQASAYAFGFFAPNRQRQRELAS